MFSQDQRGIRESRPLTGPVEPNEQRKSIKPQAGRIDVVNKKKNKPWPAFLTILIMTILVVILYLPWVSPRKTVWRLAPTEVKEYTAGDGSWIILESYKYLKEVEIPIMSELQVGLLGARNRSLLGFRALSILKPKWDWNGLPRSNDKQLLRCDQTPWTDSDRPLCERLNAPKWEQYQGAKTWDWMSFIGLFDIENEVNTNSDCHEITGSWYTERENKLTVNLLLKCLEHNSRILLGVLTKVCLQLKKKYW